MLLIYIYVALASYNTGYLTLPMNSIENVVDEKGHVAVLDSQGNVVLKKRKGDEQNATPKSSRIAGKNAQVAQNGVVTGTSVSSGNAKRDNGIPQEVARRLPWKTLWSIGTDGVMDVPIGGVCEVLYGEGRDSDSDDWGMDGDEGFEGDAIYDFGG